MNSTATHEWTIAYEPSHRSYTSKTNCPKTFCSPIWRPLKMSPRKVQKPTYGTELYRHANFYADRREICHRATNTYFPYRGLPWGYRSMLYIFWKLSSSQCYVPFDVWRCDLPFSRYSRSKFGILGPLRKNGKVNALGGHRTQSCCVTKRD